MSEPELAYEYRGGILDLIHYGELAVVDESGRTVFSVGDIEKPVYYRSASKPVQALPVIARGLDRAYGLTGCESAIFAASHAGEEFHIAALESIMAKAGLTEDMYIVKPTVPASAAANERRIMRGEGPRKLFHNCTGKHSALMLLQRDLGGEIRDYYRMDSPAQAEVLRVIKLMSETDVVGCGIDGCGVPVFAVGTKNIALAFKNLVCPERVRDEKIAQAIRDFIPNMHSYPHMIRGTGYLCTLMNMDENIVAKGGANGVYGFALKRERLGIAFKLSCGTDRCHPVIIERVLTMLGCLSDETRERLHSLNAATILNDNDLEVGTRKAAF